MKQLAQSLKAQKKVLIFIFQSTIYFNVTEFGGKFHTRFTFRCFL